MKNVPRVVDVSTWSRRAAFEFFRDFDNPYYNLTAPLRVGPLVDLCKSEGLPFSLALYYLTIRVINGYEPLRCRLQGGQVLLYDTIHPSTTELLEDDRLVFVYFDDDPDFAGFRRNAEEARRSLEIETGDINDLADRHDVVHFSMIPWVSFTSLSHARNWGREDSIPKITFGRYERSGDRVTIPVSVEVHHALVDGMHLGRFFERLQERFEDPGAGMTKS